MRREYKRTKWVFNMKIKSVTYRVQGVSDSLLESLSDENTIKFLNLLFGYLNTIYITFTIENPPLDITETFHKEVIKDVDIIMNDFQVISEDLITREYQIKNYQERIDFGNLVDLKNIHDNTGLLMLKIKSTDYFERTIAQMILNVYDYL